MQKNHGLVLLLALMAVILTVVALLGSGGGDPVPPAPQPEAPAVETPAPEVEQAPPAPSPERQEDRTTAAVPAAASLRNLHPSEAEALYGFTGRIVRMEEGELQPVPDCDVRLYRFSFDTLITDMADVWAEGPPEIDVHAGRTTTGEDGTFLLPGVWPEAVYTVRAGENVGQPIWHIVRQTPPPGGVQDLGDIQLQPTGVIVGKLVDEDGEPVAGALVRSADLPGSVLGMFPVHEVMPDSTFMIRDLFRASGASEGDAESIVMHVPAWVEGIFEELPFPITRSRADGTFRLEGVQPGQNLFTAVQRGLESIMEPAVTVVAGQEKDVGQLRMGLGEPLVGYVVDENGQPVGGAEVMAGSQSMQMIPVSLMQPVGTTDPDGKFTADGFRDGKVVLAARRTARDPWVTAPPQDIFEDVRIVLPAGHAVEVAVVGAGGRAVTEPIEFRMYDVAPEKGMNPGMLMGVFPQVDLTDRLSPTEDGQRWRIDGLGTGPYTLLARAGTTAQGLVSVEPKKSPKVTMELLPNRGLLVRVVDKDGLPIEAARIYQELRGGVADDLPTMEGRTDDAGELTIHPQAGVEVRLSARHPAYGVVGTRLKEDHTEREVILTLQPPGSIRGLLLDGGAPVTDPKWNIAATHEVPWQERGAFPGIPRMAMPNGEGRFALEGLQPGKYEIIAMDMLEGIKSPGSVMTLMQGAMMMSRPASVEVVVLPGQVAEVTLDLQDKDKIQGPKGWVTGSVTVNGAIPSGFAVMSWGQKGMKREPLDEFGRFDMGEMAAGDVEINVIDPNADDNWFRANVMQVNFKLAEGERKILDIAVQAGSVQGVVMDSSGQPVTGLEVNLNGNPEVADGAGYESRHIWTEATTDEQGRFEFKTVPYGTYHVGLSTEDRGLAAASSAVEITAAQTSAQLEFRVASAVTITGRIDMSVMVDPKPNWMWLTVILTEDQSQVSATGGASATNRFSSNTRVKKDGTFEVGGLIPGTYAVQFHHDNETDPEGRRLPGAMDYSVGQMAPLVLGPGGLTDVLIPLKATPADTGGR